MKRIAYKLIEWLLKALARLPFAALYLIADGLYFLIYHMAGYRRKVVEKNIRESFPDMAPDRRAEVVRQFYRNFADYIVETIKLDHVSDDEMRRRMTFEGMEIIDSLMEQGRSITAYFAHCGNWEWAPSVTLWSSLRNREQAWFCQIYRPLKNEFFDRWFLHLRSRFNPISIPKSHTVRELLRLRRTGLPAITGFMSDQKPSHNDEVHVIEFLNHPTAVITGTEMLARKLDNAVVYWDMYKPSRGHYTIRVRLITDAINTLPPYGVTHTYFQMLQATIERNPAIWLWSHKRWKHPVTLPKDNG